MKAITILFLFLFTYASTLNSQVHIKSNGYYSMTSILKEKCDKFTQKNPNHTLIGSIKFTNSNVIGPSNFITISNNNNIGKNDVYEMTHFHSDVSESRWEGISKDKSSSIILFHDNSGYYGTINRNNYSEILRVVPLDNSTSIVVGSGVTSNSEELVCGIRSLADCIPTLDVCGNDQLDNTDCTGDCPAHIEFLFLVSDEGYEYYSNNEMTAVNIKLMMSDLEAAWSNSKINNSASYDWVRYDYSVPTTGNCEDIATDIACQHQDIQELRVQYGADIVVLLSTPDVTWPNALACVPAIGAIPEAGYIVQPVHTALNDNTFAHEVGHVFGCNHAFSSPTKNCCGLGNTFSVNGSPIKTIMRGAGTIPYYSDPNIKYMGVPTGVYFAPTGRMNNSAGKIRTASCIVSDFVPSVTPQASIIFEQIDCEVISTALYNSTVLNDANYSFSWYVTEDGYFLENNIGQYTSLGTGESVTITDTEVGDPCENYFIHLVVLKFGQIIFHKSKILKGGICTDNVWCGPDDTGAVSSRSSQDYLNNKNSHTSPKIIQIEYFDIFGNLLLRTSIDNLHRKSQPDFIFTGVVVKVVFYDNNSRIITKSLSLN